MVLFRYLVGETAISFLIAFLFFFVIFFINQMILMAEQILSKRAPIDQVALLILYSLPGIVAMSAPFASLVGTLMAIGRLSSDSEILVMRASGISLGSIYLPVICVGAGITLISFLANDILLPAGTLEFSKTYRRLLLTTPAIEIEANSVKRFKETVLVTGPVENKRIEELLIFDRTSTGERRLIVADAAELSEEAETALTLDLSDAFVHSTKESAKQDYDYALANELRYSIKQEDLVQAIGTPGPRDMSSVDLYAEIVAKREALVTKTAERRIAALYSALAIESLLRSGRDHPKWDELSNLNLDYEKRLASLNLARDDRSLRQYLLEFHKKFSIPFGAFAFIFLATPLGLFAKKSGQSVGFGLGLLIAVVYWALLLGGQTLGTRLGYSPFWAMWLPNAIILVFGAFFSFLRFSR